MGEVLVRAERPEDFAAARAVHEAADEENDGGESSSGSGEMDPDEFAA